MSEDDEAFDKRIASGTKVFTINVRSDLAGYPWQIANHRTRQIALADDWQAMLKAVQDFSTRR